MKRIKLQIFSFLCLISSFSFGQTYSSGLTNLITDAKGDLWVKIDINVTTDVVTLTLEGDSGGWMALSFDDPNGHDGADVVMFNGTLLVDRTFTTSTNQPTTDTGGQNWTVTSDTTAGGFRTVVATRARVSPDSDDYDFSATPSTSPLNVVGAIDSSLSLSSKHDSYEWGTLTFALLGVNDVNKVQFTMSPNPATSDLRVTLPSNLNTATLEIYDVVGRQIFNGNFKNEQFSVIDVSSWNSGVYMVKVSHNNSSQTKRFIKQ